MIYGAVIVGQSRSVSSRSSGSFRDMTGVWAMSIRDVPRVHCEGLRAGTSTHHSFFSAAQRRTTPTGRL